MIKDTISIKVNKVERSRITDVDWDNLPFGKVFSDHMLVMDYKDGVWHDPEIVPFESLSMHPATSAIHYGQSIFEGMKANKNENNEVLIFRPEMNAKRFTESCKRICMPQIPESTFIQLIQKIVDIDREWVPSKEGHSLYIRPFMFATDDFIGIKPSDTYKFIIFTCPVGAYYSQPVNVKIEEYYTRAAQGGVGRAKTAGNYAASLYPAKLAQEQGFHQLIWTDAAEHKYIEESGTMNIVFEIDGKLVTPSEDMDTILRGVTKRSVVDIARHWGVEVEERRVTVEEVVTALREGRVTDAFGAGTAATIAQVAKIGFREELFELPDVTSRTLSNKIKTYLTDLKSGKVEDELNWLLKF
ncbi:MAG: branched-chain amino acid aminotransferase [Crocinitomicaceae bacterium]|jgi:branched-chain amino acid aminotransferase|nr:branched-chain amino acid aminotransferase [Crocinitomicaceae bacterium]